MNVYVVLYEDRTDKSVYVLDTYTDEQKASDRVGWERGLTNNEVWYQESDLINK